MHDTNLKKHVKNNGFTPPSATVFATDIQPMSHKDGTDGAGGEREYLKKEGGRSLYFERKSVFEVTRATVIVKEYPNNVTISLVVSFLEGYAEL